MVKEIEKPGSVASTQTSLTDSIFLSWGACKTIVVDPTTHRTHPSMPNICSLSSKMKWASTALQNGVASLYYSTPNMHAYYSHEYIRTH